MYTTVSLRFHRFYYLCIFMMQALTKYLSLLIVTCLGLLIFYTTPTMTCSCTKRNLLKIYCQADYVVVISVFGKALNKLNKARSYRINVVQTFKMTPIGNKTLEAGRLLTSRSSNDCGVNLSFFKYYLIAGRGTELNSCVFVKKVDRMNNEEKKIFRGDYSEKCSSNCNL